MTCRANPAAALLAAAALSPVSQALAQEAPPASGLSGDWVGEYVCNQGLTGLTLRIDEAPSGIRAVFVFYEAAANPGVPDGCFEMSGRYDPASGGLDFVAGRWIHRPLDYYTVDLEGRLDPSGGRYIGDVHGFNCTTFDVIRREAAPALDHPCFEPIGVSAIDERRTASRASQEE